jgi:hypothetical protein
MAAATVAKPFIDHPVATIGLHRAWGGEPWGANMDRGPSAKQIIRCAETLSLDPFFASVLDTPLQLLGIGKNSGEGDATRGESEISF